MAENRGPQLQAVDSLFLAMAVIATVLRCYTRIFLVKSFGRDDYFMVLATVSILPWRQYGLRKCACLFVDGNLYRYFSSLIPHSHLFQYNMAMASIFRT
jgi:hypothetical protein